MGRGLSPVQRRILAFVGREKFVMCQDLLTLWEVQPGAGDDKAKYAAAHAALSRALTRLFWRGLITYWVNKFSRYRTAVSLTAAGRRLAQAILEEETKEAING
jgi:DNA-binding MarR family transcriptional regulator